MATDEWGIDDGWWSAEHGWVEADRDTIDLLRAAMDPGGVGPLIVREGAEDALEQPTEIVLENGASLGERGSLPRDLPLGYHLLVDDGTAERDLVVVPRGVPAWPARSWGVTAQIYSLASPSGVGDLAALERIGGWVAAHGGRVIGVNPLGDPLPAGPRQPSPYSTSSREHLDPLLIDVARLGVDLDRSPEPRRSRPATIDRDAAWDAMRPALWRIWVDAGSPRPAARQHAVFCALAEHHGGGWHSWPEPHRRPDDPAVARFASEHPEAVGFWQWLDDLVERQLGEVTGALRSLGVEIMGDLPVGVGADGFDGWIDQHLMMPGVRVGAPPDTFNPAGQDWGLPCFDPHRLRAVGYAPFVRMLRANLARFGGLRIDHIMGLFRLYCIPDGAAPTQGAYVRFRGTELIDLVTLEAHRAGAFVVGEDLGTVEDHVRTAMGERGIAGTRVALFEEGDPGWWPERSLATLTTHDLPTLRGALEHHDPRLDERLVDHIRWFAEVDDTEPTEVAVAAHRRLGGSGSGVALATLEDLTWSADRVNLPGTIDEHPNWRIPLDESRLATPFAEAVIHAIEDGR